MTDFVIPILGVALAAILLSKKSSTKENFWGLPGRTIKRDQEVRIDNKYGAAMYSVPPTYQSMIAPRFSNTGYSAQILYNIPDQKYLGAPEFPLTYGGDVREPYSSETRAFAASAQEGAFRVPNGGAVAAIQQDIGAPNQQIYNYDRLIVAQKKSRLYGLGDPIRGDLPIAPVQSDWFRPSVYPNIDLRQGAMTVIAGHDNSTAKELRSLQAEYSGKSALAQKDISLDNGQGDIIVTAFP